MSTNPICPKCWYTNLAGTQFCYHCGTLLPKTQPAPAPLTSSPTPPPPTAPPAGPSQAPSSYGSTDYFSYYMEKKRRDGINRTKNGLLLLIIGNFLGLGTLLGFLGGTGILLSLPIIIGDLVLGLAGGILAIIGAILVILGREIFGKTHSRQVLWSVGLYIGGGVIGGISFLPFLFTLFEIRLATGGSAGLQDALVSNFYIWLIGQLIGGAIYGLAYVLVTYSLQKPFGQLVLWASYVALLAVGLVAIFYYGPQFSIAAQAAFSSGTLNRAPIDGLQAQVAKFNSLKSIPVAVCGLAYLTVWSRIKIGEIPLPATPATSLTHTVTFPTS